LVQHLGENEVLLLATLALGAAWNMSDMGWNACRSIPEAQSTRFASVSATDAIGFSQRAIKQLQCVINGYWMSQPNVTLYSVACLSFSEV